MKKSSPKACRNLSLKSQGFCRLNIALLLLLQALILNHAHAFSNSDIQTEVNTNNSFVRVSSTAEQFKKDAYVTQYDALPSQNIQSFHSRLSKGNIAALPSQQITKWIPIAGDITIFIPKKEIEYPLGKRLGDNFVQSRLIRAQINHLLGRHLVSHTYISEAAQIEAFYNNAYDLAGRSGFTKQFGDRLSETDIPAELDIIWPELRIINGENVLVPVVHLGANSLGQAVSGHIVEFFGDRAEFVNINIQSGSITTRKNALLSATENFSIAEGAVINSTHGDLNLSVGGTLINHGNISSTDSINILAGNYAQKTKVHRFKHRYGYRDSLGKITSIDAENGSVNIRSINDIVIQAANINTSGDITLNADGNISIGSVPLSRETYIAYSNFQSQEAGVDYVRSNLNAGDNIQMMAGGIIQIDASTLHADEGHIELLAEMGISIIDQQSVTQSSQHFESKRLTRDEQSYVTVAIRAVLDAGKGIVIHSSAGDITLRATDINSVDGTQVSANNGSVNMLMTVENDHYSYSSVREGMWTIKSTSRGHNYETAVPNTIVGGFAVEALYGVNVQYEGDPNLSHEEQVAELAKMPGLEWMEDIQSQYPEVDWEAVGTVYDEWDKTNSSLSPAAIAVITVVVAVCTAGAGTALVGAVGSSSATAAAVAQAAITSMATTATIATSNAVVNGENFFDATASGMDAVVSDEGLKSAATAMVTAGSISYLNAEFFSGGFGTTLKGQVTQAFANATARAAIQTIATGGDIKDFGDALAITLVQDSINALGRNITENILGSEIPEAAKFIALASTSCFTAALNAGVVETSEEAACLSAAGSSLINHIINSSARDQIDNLTHEQEELAEWITQNTDENLLTLTGEPLLEYITNSGTTDVRSFAYLSQFGSVTAQLADLTVQTSNISRLTSAFALLLVGAGSEDIYFADQNITIPARDYSEQGEVNVDSSLAIYGALQRQQALTHIGNVVYHIDEPIVDDLKEKGVLPPGYEFDAFDHKLQGRDIFFLYGLAEAEAEILEDVENLQNELEHLLDDEGDNSARIEEIRKNIAWRESGWGNIDWSSLRRISFEQGAEEGLDRFREEIDLSLRTQAALADEYLNHWHGRLTVQLEESQLITDSLDYFVAPTIVARFGVGLTDEAIENAAKLIKESIRLGKKKDAIERILDLVDGGLSSSQKKLLERDLAQSDELLKAFGDNPRLVNSWSILFKEGDAASELVRRNPENLERLSKFISETGMEESKLISSFSNAKNPQTWIDMKIPEADLDAVYDGFKNSPPAKLDAWTPEHKAQRWANHKAGNPDADFKTWSNQYDGNIDKVTAANKGIDDYISTYSGTVVREKSFSNISINTPEGTQFFARRLDIVDEDAFKGIEFKEYFSGKVYRSPDVIREYTLDGKLLQDDLLDEIEWIFKGCEPSGPLKADLEALGIKIILLP